MYRLLMYWNQTYSSKMVRCDKCNKETDKVTKVKGKWLCNKCKGDD